MAVFREHRCGCITAETTTSHGETMSVVMECSKLRKRSDEYFDKVHMQVVKLDDVDRKVEFMRCAVSLMERHVWEEHLRDEGVRVHWNGVSVLRSSDSRLESSNATALDAAATPSC